MGVAEASLPHFEDAFLLARQVRNDNYASTRRDGAAGAAAEGETVFSGRGVSRFGYFA
jgi:hypothetical protein